MPRKPKQRRCLRCYSILPQPLPLGHNLVPVTFCTHCGLMRVVREMGEMDTPEDRADPKDWGGLGFT